MARAQATWIPGKGLFFWTQRGSLTDILDAELPALDRSHVEPTEFVLVSPGHRFRRKAVRGLLASAGSAAAGLASLTRDDPVSDSVRAWSLAALLGLELAAHRRVVPTVTDGHARWAALLWRAEDRARFSTILGLMPQVSYARPTLEHGSIAMHPPRSSLQGFLDAVVDDLYRTQAYPNTSRGWIYNYGQALRADEDAFTPREARYQGIPERLSAWAHEARGTGLRVGFSLDLPDDEDGDFGLRLGAVVEHRPDDLLPLDAVWHAGEAWSEGEHAYPHPAHRVLLDLARATTIYPPLKEALRGAVPRDLCWTAAEAWAFLTEGAPLLERSGFRVVLPPEFTAAGDHRIRARLRIEALADDSPLDLSGILTFRWEVVLGDHVIEGPDFAALVAQGKPLVRYRDGWVFLDPSELARLPEGLPQDGTIPVAEALRAVLTGEHQGVTVVADDRLQLILSALREPPAVEPPAGLEATLRAYQLDGLAWLHTLGQLGLGSCLADDMGLGKTVQLIAHLLDRRGGPSLVVCPTSVLGNWQRELERFAPSLTVHRHHGIGRTADGMDTADVVLTTYGVLTRDTDILTGLTWDVVALDEAQAIKNPDSRRAHAARELVARHRVAMSGTPVENRLDELWSLMEFLNPGLLGPRGRFRREVAVPIERFGDEEVAHRLRLGVAPFLLRRLKSDPEIAPDLPDKLEVDVYCPLTREQADLYEQVMEEYLERIHDATDSERRGLVFAMLTALKQVCNHPAHYAGDGSELDGRSGKLERTMEILGSIMESGSRALLFTQYTVMGELLKKHLSALLGEAVPFLHGGLSAKRREDMVRRFQEDERSAPLMLISLKAGGTGLNLTRATHVIHYDRWWNPAVEDQATDRAYRIGQREDVTVHKLVTQDTLEERIANLLTAKRALAEQVMGGNDQWVAELDDDALRRLVTLGADAVMEEE